MNLVPPLVIALLLSSAAFLPVVQRWRPARVPLFAFLGTLAAALVWLAAAGSLPLSVTLSRWPETLALLPWQWQVDEIAWLLSALWLLLLAAALLVGAAVHLDPLAAQESDGQLPAAVTTLWPALRPWWPAVQPGLLLLLGATGLIATWSASLVGIVTGWTLLAATWIVLLLLATPFEASRRGSSGPPVGLLVRLGAGFSGPLFVWLAAAALPVTVNRGGQLAEIGQWPLPAGAWLLLAAVWQMGIFPLHLWRPLDCRLPAYTAALLHTAPALAGLSLLVRLVSATDVALSFGLPLTALGLLGLLVGVAMSWSVAADKARAVAALALGHASIVLLVGMWAGGEALLLEARVLLIGTGLLFLSTVAQNGDRPAWYTAGTMVAVAALAGLPFTAGFTGRAALYNAWLADGRFLLVLVSVLLHIPLLATAFYITWGKQPGAAAHGVTLTSLRLGLLPPAVALPEREKWPGLLVAGALLLPAMALIKGSGLPLADVHFFTWPALLVPAVAGVILLRYLPFLRETQMALRQVVGLDLPLGRLYGTVGRLLATAGSALRETAAILEGEAGLLWLILLLLLFWVAWIM
jgi:hypothetical protein